MFRMTLADLEFEQIKHIPEDSTACAVALVIRDTFSGASGEHVFPSEVVMLAFVGQVLLHADGPTDDFCRFYPMHG